MHFRDIRKNIKAVLVIYRNGFFMVSVFFKRGERLIEKECIFSCHNVESTQDKKDDISIKALIGCLLSYTSSAEDSQTVIRSIESRLDCLKDCFQAASGDLLRLDGITNNAAALIKLAGVFFNRCSNPNLIDIPHIRFDEAFEFLARKESEETVWAAFVDSQDIALTAEYLVRGETASIEVQVEKATLFAGRHEARRIVIAHYHPEMELPALSRQDILAVQYAGDTLASFGITFVGHTVIAKNGSRFVRYSFD